MVTIASLFLGVSANAPSTWRTPFSNHVECGAGGSWVSLPFFWEAFISPSFLKKESLLNMEFYRFKSIVPLFVLSCSICSLPSNALFFGCFKDWCVSQQFVYISECLFLHQSLRHTGCFCTHCILYKTVLSEGLKWWPVVACLHYSEQ